MQPQCVLKWLVRGVFSLSLLTVVSQTAAGADRQEYHRQINAGGSHASGVPAVGKGGFAIREGDRLPDPPQVQSEGSPLRWGGRLGPAKLP